MKKKENKSSVNLQKFKFLDLVLHNNVKIRLASKNSGIKLKEAKSILKNFRRERKLLKTFMNETITLIHARGRENKSISNEETFSTNSLNFWYLSQNLQKIFDELNFYSNLKENLINQIVDGERKLLILKSFIVELNKILEV
jgi:hypothetical protein